MVAGSARPAPTVGGLLWAVRGSAQRRRSTASARSSFGLELATNALAHRGIDGCRRGRGPPAARPAPQQQRNDREANGERGERKAPDEQVEPRAPRREQDPLAVARDEVFLDLLGRLAGLQALAHDRAHLRGHLRRRVGDREILADDAAQLRGHVVDRLLGDGGGARRARQHEYGHERDGERARDVGWHPRCTARPGHRADEEGPMHAETFIKNLVTEIEPNATKKVSGTPYTPYSTATLPCESGALTNVRPKRWMNARAASGVSCMSTPTTTTPRSRYVRHARSSTGASS